MSAIPGGVRQFAQTPLWKKLAPMAIPLVVGACIGWAARGERTVTVEKEATVVADESRGLDFEKHEVKKEAPKVTTRIIYRDGPVQERIVERQGELTTTTDTKAKVRDDLHVETKVAEKVVTSSEGRWAIRITGGVDTRGSILAGAGVDYRVLGPVTAGAWVHVPIGGAPGAVALGVSLGVRF